MGVDQDSLITPSQPSPLKGEGEGSGILSQKNFACLPRPIHKACRGRRGVSTIPEGDTKAASCLDKLGCKR